MALADTRGPAEDDLYTDFWALQRVFTNPPSLFTPSPSSTSSNPSPADPFASLQTSLKKTLTAFAAATKKEKDLGGGDSGKQKARSLGDDESMEHYFFPKFLTSKNLLELEVSFAHRPRPTPS